MDNRTKIIATIGPASEDPAVLQKMIAAGMDSVRLNFSHGTHAQHAQIIKRVREISKKHGKHICIIQDLQGPKIRIGDVADAGITVKTGETVVLSTENEKHSIPVQYKNLPRDCRAGDLLLIDDGLIELRVLKINSQKTHLECEVLVGGVIKSHKGINAPQASISAPPLTEKDRKDVLFGIKHGVDFVALSFVKEAANIYELKKFLRSHNASEIKIIAKIERHEAIKNMEEIIEASDAVMVARGDLGIEMPAECVPLFQKKIIHVSNGFSKPVIVATQMLNSMIENPRPTRAEISDAATAIFDHADAFMLSNETAVGKYPVEAVSTLRKVATAVENDLKRHQHLLSFRKPEDMPLTNAACLNACKLAKDINAKFIVAITRSGYTAAEIAKYRPFIPIVVFTPNQRTARELAIVWGVTKTFVQFINLGNPLAQIRKSLLKEGFAKTGDEIVVCNTGFGKREKLITTTML